MAEILAFRVKEASALTGLPVTRLYTEIANGSLVAIRIGRSLRITPAALQQWLDAHSTQPAEAS